MPRGADEDRERAEKKGEEKPTKEPGRTVLAEPGAYTEVIRFLNRARSAQELAAEVEFPGERDVGLKVAENILARRTALGGMFRTLEEVDAVPQVGPERLAEIAHAAELRRRRPLPTIEPERAQFRALILQNPNYFGNLEISPYKPVKPLQGLTTYEELVCVGLNPPFDRLEGVVHLKRESGYGGELCSLGSLEYVRFYVDLYDNGTWHDVGLASVRIHDIPGDKPLSYAVKLDFESFRKLCFFENIVRVRAILSWNVPPPANTPGFTPVWGNALTVQVQVRPRHFIIFDDLLKPLKEAVKIPLPDPIGPIIKLVDPQTKIQAVPPEPLSLAQKKALYQQKGVPAHRFAFPEAQKLLATPLAAPNIFAAGAQGPLAELGLSIEEIKDLLGKLQVVTDGDTSYEELKCIGLRPEDDLLESVLTVKKSSGYSGGPCTKGSTEYVAFWIDFNDGAGFSYMGTATVPVYDLQTIPAEDVQYAVFLKTDLSKRLVPCQVGARIVRLRAILSWESSPPPANPNYVPVWGNREERLIQLRPGELVGHIPVMETVGNLGVDDIDAATGLGTGSGVGAAFTANQAPFGGQVKISGRLGDTPDSFGGGAPRFKYKIEVSPVGVDDWHPLTNPVSVKSSEALFGVPQECDPIGDPGAYVCDQVLTASDDGDGLSDGWYEYLEDLKGPAQRFLVLDQLANWQTNAHMEGLWKIRISAKDPSTSPPTVFPGIQEVVVRIDNTAPSSPPLPIPPDQPYRISLKITGATYSGSPLPATDCGTYPVGTLISGTYEVHDPGTSDAVNQHFGLLTLGVIPAGPAHGAVVVPSSRAFPVVPTAGEAGTWTLNTGDMAAPNPPTSPMHPCGYVIRLWAEDRTNVDSRGAHFQAAADVGFCLVAPEGM